MSTLSTPEKLIRRMHKSYNDARKLIKAAMAECSVGTNTHLMHVKALAELDAKERLEEISIGIVPQDLQQATRTEYHYIAHVHVMPANRAEAKALVRAETAKDVSKLHYSDADEEIRRKLEQEFQ
jgi:hypothetical protein